MVILGLDIIIGHIYANSFERNLNYFLLVTESLKEVYSDSQRNTLCSLTEIFAFMRFSFHCFI